MTGWAADFTGVALLLFPAIDKVKSPRDLATRIAALPQKPSEIPCVSVHPEGYRFYGGIPAVEAVLADLQDHLAREGSSFLALIPQSVWSNIPLEERLPYRSLLEERVGSREIIVLVSAERSVR